MNDPRSALPQHGVSHPQGPGLPRPAMGQPPRAPGVPGPAQGQPRPVQATVPHRPAAVDSGVIELEDDEPIALEEVPSAPVTPGQPRLPAAGGVTGLAAAAAQPQAVGLGPSKIKFASGGDKHAYTKFKRPSHVTGTGACHVRSFHGRLSDDGLAFMDDKINEWLDNHPDVEVKFVNCFTGPLEGKVTGEQGLIVTIWY